MTNQTNLDFLFQLTAAPDRATNGGAASGGQGREFGEHLFQATTAPAGTRNTSPLQSNSTEGIGRVQNRTINSSDQRPSVNNTTAERSSDLPAADARSSGEAVNTQSDEKDTATTENMQAPADASDEAEDGGVTAENENDEEVVAAAIADGDAIRQTQTAKVAKAEDVGDAESTEVSSDSVEGTEKLDAKLTASEKTASEAVAAAATGSGEADIPVNHSTAAADVADVVAEHAIVPSTDVAATEIGESSKQKGREPKGRKPAVTTTNAAGATTLPAEDDTAVTRNGTSAPVKANHTAAAPNPLEKRIRYSSKDGTAERDEAAPSTNKVAVPAAAPTQPAQQSSAAVKAVGESESTRSAAKAGATTTDLVHSAVGRSQRAAGKGAQRVTPAQANDLPRVDAARFVGRVAKAVQVAHERGGSLQLRLSPPELGSLRLELTVQNGVMTASLEAETPAARQVLLDHLPALRDRLAEQNIRVERFDVDVRQEPQHGGSDPRASQQHERQQQPQQSSRHQPVSTADVPESITDDRRMTPSHLAKSGINVLA